MRVWISCLLVLSLAEGALAQSITERGDFALEAYSWNRATAPAGYVENRQNTLPSQVTPGLYEFKGKSVAKAFAYSLLLPGAGQFYNGSKVKGFAFLGVEVLGWAAYLMYHSSGTDKKGEYEAFARAHWYEQPYWDSLKIYRNVDKWKDGEEFAHHLPFRINENGDTVGDLNHEYYENIGKYDQFVWGWDDLQQFEPINTTNPEVSFQSKGRLDYEGMREDANAQYDHARAAAIVVIANHVVSAVEAALAAKRYNNKAQHAAKIEFNVNLVNVEDTPTPWVRVAYRF